jgi:hypothetical protein
VPAALMVAGICPQAVPENKIEKMLHRTTGKNNFFIYLIL